VAVAWRRLLFLCVSLKTFTAEKKATIILSPDSERSLQADRLAISVLITLLTDEMAN